MSVPPTATAAIAVSGDLDEPRGEALLRDVAIAIDDGVSRIEVDLQGIQSFTAAGAGLLVACRDLGSRLPDGLVFRTVSGPGEAALLAAFAEDGVEFGST
jgi:anti-anti-sigma regulatory factor